MIEWVPISSSYFWQIELHSFYVGEDKNVLNVESAEVILDTGSSLCYLPSSDFYVVYGAISQDNSCYILDYYGYPQAYCDCNPEDIGEGFPDLFIKFGSHKTHDLRWEPQHYLMWDEHEGSCMVLIQEEVESAWFWLLGDSFLRAFFTVYDVDNKQIALIGDLDYQKWTQDQVIIDAVSENELE
jgi:hypothetical protein